MATRKNNKQTALSKSTPKRHTATPRTMSATTKAASKKAATSIVRTDAIARAIDAVVENAVVETEVSPAIDSNPTCSAVMMAAPADAGEKMLAEISADSVMANTSSTAALVNSLRDSSADVASDAAATLGATGDRSAVKPLSEVIANTDGFFHPVVRAAAATSLGKLGDKKAVPALITGIRDEMAEASAESIRALAAISDPRAVAPLIDVVRNADSYYLSFVRRAAVLALVKLGGPEATAALRIVAENYDEDPVIRQVAVDALV